MKKFAFNQGHAHLAMLIVLLILFLFTILFSANFTSSQLTNIQGR